MSEHPLPRRCGIDAPGHEINSIQGLRAGNDPDCRSLPGVLLDAEDDGTIRVEVDGAVQTYWTHDFRVLEAYATLPSSATTEASASTRASMFATTESGPK